MVHNGIMVIACGGGGIPVVKDGYGYQGIDAVIDKDRTSAKLAADVEADMLIILTAVETVKTGFGTETVKINDQDFRELIGLINTAYRDSANEYFRSVNMNPDQIINELKNASDQEKYTFFSNLVDLYPKAWEFDGYYESSRLTKEQNDEAFLKKVDAILPAEIRNSGDPTVLENYYIENTKGKKSKKLIFFL